MLLFLISITMEDYTFVNVLQCSMGWKGTILDGIADKYLIFPTGEDGLRMCKEAHSILTRHYVDEYTGDKESLEKVKCILESNKPTIENYNPTAFSREYDPNGNRTMFRTIIYCFKQLQQIEKDIIEQRLIDQMRMELKEKREREKAELHAKQCSACPTCKK